MDGTELTTVDFQHASEETRQVINEWVKGQMKGKIPKLLTEGMVDSMTKLLLVNATYFKGKWKHKFPIQDTHEGQFRLNKKETEKVMMIYQKKKFSMGYSEDLRTHIIHLSYRVDKFSMVILLPENIEDGTIGLQKIEKQIYLENFNEWMKPENMTITFVKFYLPRFKMKEKYILNSYLTHLGLTKLFDPDQADLSGMSVTRDLSISKIGHKSFVEVNEEGTEVNITTAVNVHFSMLKPEVEFKVNRPFNFFIVNNLSHNILFLDKSWETRETMLNADWKNTPNQTRQKLGNIS